MLGAIKRASTDAVNAAKPFALTYGVVTGVGPLTIRIDQKLELGPAQLLLTNAVREFGVNVTAEDAYTERKKVMVHLGLAVGEKVLLFRCQGGQQYIVLDRVEAP